MWYERAVPRKWLRRAPGVRRSIRSAWCGLCLFLLSYQVTLSCMWLPIQDIGICKQRPRGDKMAPLRRRGTTTKMRLLCIIHKTGTLWLILLLLVPLLLSCTRPFYTFMVRASCRKKKSELQQQNMEQTSYMLSELIFLVLCAKERS